MARRTRNFWSCRVNRDIRIIIHKTASSFLLAYVDHHDQAYTWAERRRIEAHPTTGAVQIVEVRERVEETAKPPAAQLPFDLGDGIAPVPIAQPSITRKPFETLGPNDLMAIGVPPDWLADVTSATEDGFLDLAQHLPGEAGEALLEFASSGILKKPEPVVVNDPFTHPDAQRRFRVIENVEELERALDLPWEQWAVFLHPSQRALVTRTFGGPARVAGSAGTGKTMVAVHRAVFLARRDDARRTPHDILGAAGASLEAATVPPGDARPVVPRITVASFEGIAVATLQPVHGRSLKIAGREESPVVCSAAAAADAVPAINERFLQAGMDDMCRRLAARATGRATADVARLGRKTRLAERHRDRLWSIFETCDRRLEARELVTAAGMFDGTGRAHSRAGQKPFDFAVVDEAQDLGSGTAAIPGSARWPTARTPVLRRRPRPANLSAAVLLEDRWASTCVGVPARCGSTTGPLIRFAE